MEKVVKNKFLQHLGFWCFSFIVLLNIQKVSADVKQIDLIYTAIFHVPFVLIVYLNLNVLFPQFLEKEKYLLYGLSLLAAVAIGSGFYLLLFEHWIDFVFRGYYFIAYYGFWDISLYFVIYLAATSLIRLARGWFRLQEMETEKTLTELKALRSQINPHFLFNSLNSIYSLARKKSKMVPEKVVQLSDLMRHIIYQSEADFIPLEIEIEMIRNYIELQNLRTSDEQKIELKINGDTSSKKIAPLLFLPFVENSFKHGLKGGADDAFVTIEIEIQQNVLNFLVQNSKGFSAEQREINHKGIGIENVRKRLELLYPGQHKLEISDDSKIFKVMLQVQIK